MYRNPQSTSRKMFIGLCQPPAGRLPLLALLCLPVPAWSGALEVAYAPEVVFRGRPLTLRIERAAERPLLLSTNGVDSVAAPAGSGPVAELILSPDAEGDLAIREVGGETETFRVGTPDAEAAFT